MQFALIFSIFRNFHNIRIQIFKIKFLIMFLHGTKSETEKLNQTYIKFEWSRIAALD